MGEDPVDEPVGLAAPNEAEAAVDPAAEQLERRARVAEERLVEVMAAYRQARVDNEGFRDRMSRQIERQFDRRRERLVLKFIEILDNLDRALEAAEQTYAGNPLIEGLILVRSQLLQTLHEEGLERIPVLGLPYDPAVSEAVSTVLVADADHDHVVVKELLRGYRLHGRVARASRVVIGRFEAAAESAETEEVLIGADELDAVERQPEERAEPALDETTLQQIFGERGGRGE